MRRFTLALLAFFAPVLASAQMPVSPETRATVAHIIGDVMVNGQAYEYDRQLADTIGPRLTGSDNYVHAVAWAQQQFKSLGLANVHTEPFTLKSAWEPETAATGRIVTPRVQNLHIYSLGWSPSTADGGIKGNVVYLQHLTNEGIDAQKDKLAGNIVLIDRDSIGESPAFSQILQALDHLNKLAPKALLLVGGPNGSESATALTFDGSIFRCPTAEVGAEDTSLIRRMLDHVPVSVEFSFKNRIRQDVEVNNVVAEIPGRDLPNEVVIIAGHLDSWHPATGAQDNGTGASTVIEAARAIKASGRAPRRTMRFILFGGEEQGILGSTAYVNNHRADLPSIDCVLISDTGAQPAKGWYLMGRDDEMDALKNVEPLLAGLGSNDTTPSTEFLFQTDHISFDLLGVPTLVLWNDTDKYFKLHHKASDSFDAINQADLNQGAATTIATAYAIADSAQPFAPHQTPTQVEEWLKKAKQWDDYQFFKNAGVFP
ncbi:M20/M25/M40 family metallo-hydrolase [Edaphobacter aggregans]|uniref:M20/M25/M40 family metallo-hydrolase n=1 Tax=Edaphobacter aggregans TaxID=570835 RepID=UPI0005555003|nr:M20/M25/M40 family metallo-hydrolase [Edaphobacter aggregans]